MTSTQIVEYDIFIIGGGINGTAIANDAAGRGLRVGLCEKGDLANATSSASSKLIHGGLRYLEHFEFKLVRSALRERAILLQNAPHLVTPLEFIMPYTKSIGRSSWMIRAGLWLYDILATKSSLGPSSQIQLHNNYIKKKFKLGFRFWDAWGDDARLVICNALAAKSHGAEILSRTRFVSTQRFQDHWQVTLENQKAFSIRTKVLINAAGPWVDEINSLNHIATNKKCRLIKGSHIILPRLYPGDHSLLLQNYDSRIVFITPYSHDQHLVGTTEEEYTGDPNQAKINTSEISYLLNCINTYLSNQVTENQIQGHFSGVRPLQDEKGESASKVTRDYFIDVNRDQAPYLSIFGGKITTHRALAEKVLHSLTDIFPQHQVDWTAHAKLPGGDFLPENRLLEIEKLKNQYAWLNPTLIEQYFARYGTLTHKLLRGARKMQDMGIPFSDTLYEREVRYLIDQEWAQSAEDILWRRTKLGCHFSPEQTEALELWLLKEF